MLRIIKSYITHIIIISNGLLIPFYSTLSSSFLWVTNLKKIRTISVLDIFALCFLTFYPLSNHLIGVYSFFESFKVYIILLSTFLFAKNLKLSKKADVTKFFLFFLGYIAFFLILFLTNDSLEILRQRFFISPFTGKEINSPPAVFLGSLVFIFVPYIDINKKTLSLGIISSILLMIYFISLTGARTPYIIFVIIIIYDLFSRLSIKIVSYLSLIYLGVAFFFYYYIYIPYSGNFLSITRFRLDGVYSERINAYRQISDLFKENLIGSNVSIANSYGYKYWHNIFLDILDMSGIIPFLFLLAIFIYYIRNIITLVLSDRSPLKGLFISLFVLITIYYNLEPVPYYGVPWLAILLFSVVTTSNYRGRFF